MATHQRAESRGGLNEDIRSCIIGSLGVKEGREIVVETAAVVLGQLVVDADPTPNQYHPPIKKRFLVDRSSLVPAPGSVLAATDAAKQPCRFSHFLISMMVGSFLAVWLLSWLNGKHAARLSVHRSEPGHEMEQKETKVTKVE